MNLPKRLSQVLSGSLVLSHSFSCSSILVVSSLSLSDSHRIFPYFLIFQSPVFLFIIYFSCSWFLIPPYFPPYWLVSHLSVIFSLSFPSVICCSPYETPLLVWLDIARHILAPQIIIHTTNIIIIIHKYYNNYYHTHQYLNIFSNLLAGGFRASVLNIFSYEHGDHMVIIVICQGSRFCTNVIHRVFPQGHILYSFHHFVAG